MNPRHLRSLVLVFFLSLGLGFSVSCRHTVTPENARAAAAITADAIVIRVNELQAAVIQLCGPARTCAPNTIPTATADLIVQTSIDLRTVLKSVPNGWQQSVKTAWSQARGRFGVITNPAIVAALSALDVVIGGLQ